MPKESDYYVARLIRKVSRHRRPATLYHYTSAQGLRGILESGSVWASNIRFLNDSREYQIAVDLAREIIQRRLQKATSGIERGLYGVMEDSLEHVSDTEVFVSAFTRNGDQLSQWRGYCPGGAGYSIGFSSKHLADASASTPGPFLVRCVYDRSKQRELVTDLVDDVFEFGMDVFRAMDANPDRALRETHKLTARLMPLAAPALKDSTFSEEDEWRLVEVGSAIDHTVLHFRTTATVLIPYRELPLASSAGDFPVVEVIVGPMSNPELGEHAVGQLLGKLRVRRANVRRSTIPFRTW
jgi:hypothetical protein